MSITDTAMFQLRLTDAGGAEVEWTSWHEDVDRQYFRLSLVSPLEVDQQYYLTMEFAGFLEKPDLRGFYVTGYPDDQGVTRLVYRIIARTWSPRKISSYSYFSTNIILFSDIQLYRCHTYAKSERPPSVPVL